jgi:hypothetical protein
MQPTGSIEPIFVLGHVAEAPGRHRRDGHEPRLCAVCAAPLDAQRGGCWRCGTARAAPVRPVAARSVQATPRSPLRAVPATPVAHAVPGRRTPLWTRHTPGAIEAGRDRRLERRAPAPVRYHSAPRAGAVVTRADFAGDRWADEGGSFDRDAAAAVRRSHTSSEDALRAAESVHLHAASATGAET